MTLRSRQSPEPCPPQGADGCQDSQHSPMPPPAGHSQNTSSRRCHRAHHPTSPLPDLTTRKGAQDRPQHPEGGRRYGCERELSPATLLERSRLLSTLPCVSFSFLSHRSREWRNHIRQDVGIPRGLSGERAPPRAAVQMHQTHALSGCGAGRRHPMGHHHTRLPEPRQQPSKGRAR